MPLSQWQWPCTQTLQSAAAVPPATHTPWHACYLCRGRKTACGTGVRPPPPRPPSPRPSVHPLHTGRPAPTGTPPPVNAPRRFPGRSARSGCARPPMACGRRQTPTPGNVRGPASRCIALDGAAQQMDHGQSMHVPSTSAATYLQDAHGRSACRCANAHACWHAGGCACENQRVPRVAHGCPRLPARMSPPRYSLTLLGPMSYAGRLHEGQACSRAALPRLQLQPLRPTSASPRSRPERQ